MVSLFVVVVGSTPSHVSAARAGVPSVGLPSAHVVAPEATMAPDDATAPVELAGLVPGERPDGPPAGTTLEGSPPPDAPAARSTGVEARGPPTA